MSVDRSDVLQLLADGKITAVEAAALLSSIKPAEKPVDVELELDEPVQKLVKQTAVTGNGRQPTWFRIRVKDLDTGRNKVSVNIPVKMLNLGLRIGRRFSHELDDLDWDEIGGLMTDLEQGMLVEVKDETSHEHVQLFLE
ncbi:MAG: hypothetical protein Kow0080_18560 [Candidatus Promineifilaceae bacterium]